MADINKQGMGEKEGKQPHDVSRRENEQSSPGGRERETFRREDQQSSAGGHESGNRPQGQPSREGSSQQPKGDKQS